MKFTKIKSTRGKDILIDTCNQRILSGFNWAVARGYAYTSIRNKRIYMHHLVIGKCPSWKGAQVDHINLDKLDNRKMNLRWVTATQNCHNRPRYQTKTSSKYLGVTKVGNRWRAQIRHGRYLHCGYYATELEAAKARDAMAKKKFGKTAFLNFNE